MRNRTAFTLLPMCWAVAGCEDPRADCARIQEPERAIRACTALINSGRETKHTVAIALYNRGIAKNNKGKYEDAILDFTQAAKLYRDDAKIYFQRALASFSVGRTAEAIADYTEALRLNPRYQLAFSRRAAAEVAQEHYPAAISDATEAVKINPEDDFAYATRAAARYFMRDYSGSDFASPRATLHDMSLVRGHMWDCFRPAPRSQTLTWRSNSRLTMRALMNCGPTSTGNSGELSKPLPIFERRCGRILRGRPLRKPSANWGSHPETPDQQATPTISSAAERLSDRTSTQRVASISNLCAAVGTAKRKPIWPHARPRMSRRRCNTWDPCGADFRDWTPLGHLMYWKRYYGLA